MSKLISIIVPCYNVEKYIVRCLESLVNQTIGIENLEIILVNDASPDSTLSYLLEYERKYPDSIIVIDYKENKGLSGARNIGLAYVTGDYIAFLDSDDFVELTMYEELYSRAIQYDCDIAMCRFMREYNEDSSESYKILNGLKDMIYDIESDGQREKLIVSDMMGVNVWNKLYRRGLILDNKIEFPEGLVYEDIFWSAMISLYVKRIFIVEKNLYHYCINNESIVSKMNKAYHFDRFKVDLIRWQEYEKRGVLSKYKEALEYDFLRTYYYLGLRTLFYHFDNPPYEVFLQMKKTVLMIIPDYKNNKYLDSNVKESLKWMFDILDKEVSKEEFEELNLYVKEYGMEKERED